jgi:hypothetical protein
MSSPRDAGEAVPREGHLKAVLRQIDATLPGELAALHAALDRLSRSPRLAEAERLLATKGRRDA